MPRLLNDAVQLKGTTGTNSFFITLDTAQPNLGRTPTTATGYTLVTGLDGQLQFTSTLGSIKFENGIIQSSIDNGNITIQSTGSGRVDLTGNIYINGQEIGTGDANFTNLTTTNLTVNGSTIFTSASSTATFLGSVIITPDSGSVIIDSYTTGSIENVNIGTTTPGYGRFTQVETTSANISSLTSENIDVDILTVNTATVYQNLQAQGEVSLNTVGKDVTISPSDNGTVYIDPDRTGYMDNMIIGSNTREAGYFTNLVADTLSLNQELVITTASFTNLTVTNITVTGTSLLTDLTVTGNSTLYDLTVTNTLYADEIYDNGNRVITDFNLVTGPGLTGTTLISNSTVTLSLTNTGVLSVASGTGTAISSTTGDIIIWNTATLQNVTDNGSQTTNVISITNDTSSTTSTNGALIVSGGMGLGDNLHASGNVYSEGGSSYYNRLLYTPKVTVDTTPPTDPRIGDFWIDPSVGVEYQLVPNGTATIWVQFIGF